MPVLRHPSPRGRISRQRKLTDDADWVEVRYINSYAAFMGYLSMAVKGLGFLVFTWTTVVLLGGFVSVLEKKDFWCLTVITLLQTRAFNGFVKEKLSDIGYWYSALFSIAINSPKLCLTNKGGDSKPNYGLKSSLKRLLVALTVGMQVIVSTVILCPLIALHMSGLYITSGISLWRLSEHDFGGKDGEVNLKLGLEVLYSLVLLQGALFCYKTSCFHTGRRLAEIVGHEYGFRGRALKSVKHYLRDTRAGCFKDPSFAKERNLLTYAVDLMGSQSLESYESGLRILDTLIGPGKRTTDMVSTASSKSMTMKRRMKIKQMIGSASCSHVLHKLLQTLDSTSQYHGEMRERAARIVAHLASDIRLEQFPRGIQCISSMLETPSSQKDGGSSRATKYKELMLQGLCILGKLNPDGDYCDAIWNTKGLLSKIIAPVSSDLLHCIRDHNDWSAIVAASLQVMCQIVTAAGNTADLLRREISENSRAMGTMQKILDCGKCSEELYVLAIKILTQLDNKSKESFIRKLLDIFVIANKDSHIRELAGEKLATLSVESEDNARIILNKNDDFVRKLTKVLLQDESKECRITAAWILETLCTRYCTDEDDECVSSLKEIMIDAMPKVLKEVLPCGTNEKEVENKALFTQASCESCDLEKGKYGHDSQDSVRNYYTSAQPDDVNDKDRQLQVALLSFSITVFDKLIDADQNLPQQVASIARQDSGFSLARKLKVLIEGNSMLDHPTVDCLKIVKLTTKMAIAMMKNVGWHSPGEDLNSLNISLSEASVKMSDFDGLMIISSAGGDHGDVERTDVTLDSLVKEALDKIKPRSLAIVAVALSRET